MASCVDLCPIIGFGSEEITQVKSFWGKKHIFTLRRSAVDREEQQQAYMQLP
jgi:hypothetical protein